MMAINIRRRNLCFFCTLPSMAADRARQVGSKPTQLLCARPTLYVPHARKIRNWPVGLLDVRLGSQRYYCRTSDEEIMWCAVD